MQPLQAVTAGAGPATVLLPAFALTPATYQRSIDLLARDVLVVVPWYLRVTDGTWSPETILTGLDRLLDELGVATVTLVGHSLGGALALAYAARRPERVRRLVLVDALAAAPSRRHLARLGLPGRHLLTLASLPGARAFVESLLTRPVNVMRSGWWGFSGNLRDPVARVAATDVERVVLWARDDSMLPLAWGRDLAQRIEARLVVVDTPRGGRRVDHDWAFRHPQLFAGTMRAENLLAGDSVDRVRNDPHSASVHQPEPEDTERARWGGTRSSARRP